MIKNPLSEALNSHRILLASASPRRQQYLKDLGVSFKVVKNEVEEHYPPQLKGEEIAKFLAKLKANGMQSSLEENEILITADTVVWHRNRSLAKPQNSDEARKMLRELSNAKHEVITAVCFTSAKKQLLKSCITEVHFKALSSPEIEYYVETFSPIDKAGAYGIQEWLGMIAIEEIKGSYSNVVGLPTHLVYKTLIEMAS